MSNRPSHYAKYIKELKNIETLEDSEGFITYKFIEENNEKWCYIEEFYVVPEARSSGKVAEYTAKVTKIAKDANCVKLLGSIAPSLPGSQNRLEILLHYGFKLYSSQNDFIFVTKEI